MEQFNPQVSYFTTTFRPCFKVESAPEGKQFIHVPQRNGPAFQIFERIRDGFWKDLIHAAKTGNGGYDKNKKHLPCFTPSGVFRIRCDWDLLQYSQIVHLDYDDVENLESVCSRIVKCIYTMAVFISPGGKGLKVFVRVNTGQDHHAIAFTQVRKLYDDLAGLTSDSTARNISRLCYVSSDPNCFINTEAPVFAIDTHVKSRFIVPDVSILANNSDGIFSFIYNLTQKGKFQGEIFPEGYARENRNKFLFLFACNCNRYGIDSSICQEYCKMIWVANNEGFSVNELERTVRSAYSYIQEHGTFDLPKHLRQ